MLLALFDMESPGFSLFHETLQTQKSVTSIRERTQTPAAVRVSKPSVLQASIISLLRRRSFGSTRNPRQMNVYVGGCRFFKSSFREVEYVLLVSPTRLPLTGPCFNRRAFLTRAFISNVTCRSNRSNTYLSVGQPFSMRYFGSSGSTLCIFCHSSVELDPSDHWKMNPVSFPSK